MTPAVRFTKSFIVLLVGDFLRQGMVQGQTSESSTDDVTVGVTTEGITAEVSEIFDTTSTEESTPSIETGPQTTETSTGTVTAVPENASLRATSPACEYSNWSACTCNGTNGICVSQLTKTCNDVVTVVAENASAEASCLTGVNGGWSDWVAWSMCTAMCDGGQQNRSRTCTHPAPAYGGAVCGGDSHVIQECNTEPCKLSDKEMSYGLYVQLVTTMTVSQYNSIKIFILNAIVKVLNTYCNDDANFISCCSSTNGTRRTSRALTYVNSTTVILGGGCKPNATTLDFYLAVAPSLDNDLCRDGFQLSPGRRKRGVFDANQTFLSPAVVSRLVSTENFTSTVATTITKQIPSVSVVVSNATAAPAAVLILFTMPASTTIVATSTMIAATSALIAATSSATSTTITIPVTSTHMASTTVATVAPAITTETSLALIVGASVGGGLGLIAVILITLIVVKKTQSKIGTGIISVEHLKNANVIMAYKSPQPAVLTMTMSSLYEAPSAV